MHITTFLAVLKTWNFSGKSGKNFGHGTDLEKKSMEKNGVGHNDDYFRIVIGNFLSSRIADRHLFFFFFLLIFQRRI